ncbi:MAG: hypothetical protein JO316_19805 [Abitibacteriaceae bacterium]|nr:hypothetical protein [Abditibacteriaceae bacterium]
MLIFFVGLAFEFSLFCGVIHLAVFYGTKWFENRVIQRRAVKAQEIEQHSVTVEVD